MKPYSLFYVFIFSLVISLFSGFTGYIEDIICEDLCVYAPVQTANTDDITTCRPLSDKININTATKKELELLDGIGPVFSERIVKYRNTSGNFEVPEDILKISGIGENRFFKIKNDISIK